MAKFLNSQSFAPLLYTKCKHQRHFVWIRMRITYTKGISRGGPMLQLYYVSRGKFSPTNKIRNLLYLLNVFLMNMNFQMMGGEASDLVLIAALSGLCQISEGPGLQIVRVRVFQVSSWVILVFHHPHGMKRGNLSMTDGSIVFQIKFLVATTTRLATCLIYISTRRKYWISTAERGEEKYGAKKKWQTPQQSLAESLSSSDPFFLPYLLQPRGICFLDHCLLIYWSHSGKCPEGKQRTNQR